MNIIRHHFGESGESLENEYLGVVDRQKFEAFLVEDIIRLSKEKSKEEFDEEYKAMFRGRPPYHKMFESLKIIETLQQLDPLNPRPFFANLIRKNVESNLRDSLDEKDLVVYYYTASSDYITKKNILMKTDADVHHKADAFFKVVIPGRRDEYIRLDFTINPEKDETKADVLIKASNDIDYENNDIELKLLVDGVVFDTAEVLSYRSPLLTR